MDEAPRASTSERAAMHDRYRTVRRCSLALCEGLSAEDLVVQSMPDASPVKWHLAHTTWFFEIFLLQGHEPDHRPFHPRYGYLFNSYYEAVGPRHARPRRGLLTRPSLDEVLAYRAQVDARVESLLEQGPLDGAAAAVLELGLQHEQQHQELVATDLLHALSANPLLPAAYAAPSAAPAGGGARLTFVPHPGGLVDVGHGGCGFAFDNEGPRHRVWLEPFALASRLVTNREWLAFVEEGGYRRAELWLHEGIAAVRAEGWEAPLHWRREGSGFRQFTLHGERPLDLDAPVVHVCFYEADAYARWAGARLPGEEEWEAAAAAAGASGPASAPGAFLTRPAEGAGLRQLFGEAWQWTRSAHAAYPGYRPPPGALGEYNGKFMCNQLVLRGSSCATPPGHARLTYRNFFHPADRWQFSGVRLAREA